MSKCSNTRQEKTFQSLTGRHCKSRKFLKSHLQGKKVFIRSAQWCLNNWRRVS